MKFKDQKENRTPIYLLLIFVLFTIGIIISGVQYYKGYEKQHRTEVEQQLTAIAELKVSQIVQWRKERLGDGNVFYKNEAFTEHIIRYFKNPNDLEAKNYIQVWLKKQKIAYGYDAAFISDTSHTKRIIFSVKTERPKTLISQHKYNSLKSGKIVFEDFYRDETLQKIFMKVLIPILDEKNNNKLIAIVELRIDPETYLYPLINSWPTPSKTSETLIAIREGDSAVFLNELKFEKNTALNLYIPLDRKDILVVKAVLGEKGVVEGLDYKGDEVIGYVCPVPNSPWFMVARMDKAEVLSPLKEKLWMMLGFVIILILGTGLGLGFIWRHQSVKTYKEKAEAAEELKIANKELAYQNEEKEKRAAELIIANKELAFQNEEKAKRAAELIIANKELAFQNEEKAKRAAELIIAQEALITSETLYRNLFESAKDGILILDAETGSIVDVNPFLIDMLGLLKESFIKKTIWEIGYFKDIVANRDKFLEIKQNKYVHYKNLPLETNHGRHIEVEFISNVYYANDKKVIQCSIRDITERKLVEDALRESEEKFYKAFMMISPYAITITNLKDGKFIEVNDAFTSIAGYTREEALDGSSVGMNLWVNDKDRNYVINELLEGREVAGKEFVFRKKNGELITGLFSAQIIQLNNEPYILSSINDITEHKQAEEKIRSASLYARSLIEASLDPLITISPDGKITDVNKATTTATGFSPERLIGNDFSNYFTEPEKAIEGYRKVLAEGFLRDYPLAIRHSSGKIMDVLYNAAVYKDEKGNRIGVFAAARDVTERQRAEEAIKKLNAELEQRVIERTADLESANKELEAFSYSVSHDLRAPLRHISGFVGLLIDNNSPQLDETGLKYLNTISRASVEMGNLIDELLIFSRINKAEVKQTKINSRNLINSVIKTFSDEINSRKVEINISELPDIKGDENLIKQVWINLISNAIKFTRHKEKAVIEIGGKTENGETIFYIKDNGAGFDMKYADKLFGVFQRLHKTSEFEGIGIGLANVNRIIMRHKGKCRAESEVGNGATFFFSIPNN